MPSTRETTTTNRLACTGSASNMVSTCADTAECIEAAGGTSPCGYNPALSLSYVL
jgi:hypothetical protein